MKEIIEEINKNIEGQPEVVLEAGHIYSDQKPGLEQERSLQIGGAVASAASIPVRRILFIDNFNVDECTLAVLDYEDWTRQRGFFPTQTIMEADLVPEAFGLLDRLKERIQRKKFDTFKDSGKGLKVWTKVGAIPLVTSDARPACALLDAALYVRKSQMAKTSLTVLPTSYRQQQSHTEMLLEKLGVEMRIGNIYFNSVGADVSPSVQFKTIGQKQ